MMVDVRGATCAKGPSNQYSNFQTGHTVHMIRGHSLSKTCPGHSQLRQRRTFVAFPTRISCWRQLEELWQQTVKAELDKGRVFQTYEYFNTHCECYKALSLMPTKIGIENKMTLVAIMHYNNIYHHTYPWIRGFVQNIPEDASKIMLD